MTSFKNVAIGGRFFYDGWEYIKIYCPQSGKIGAVDLYSGTHITDCANWMVELPTKPTKEKKKDSQIAVFTFEFGEGNPPVIMRITEEQKRIIEILYDYDILTDDVDVNFKDDTFIVDATKE